MGADGAHVLLHGLFSGGFRCGSRVQVPEPEESGLDVGGGVLMARNGRATKMARILAHEIWGQGRGIDA